MNPHLDWPAEQTLGTHVDVSHSAATAPGLQVTVTARLIQVDRRRLTFEVEAYEQRGIDQPGREGTYSAYYPATPCNPRRRFAELIGNLHKSGLKWPPPSKKERRSARRKGERT